MESAFLVNLLDVVLEKLKYPFERVDEIQQESDMDQDEEQFLEFRNNVVALFLNISTIPSFHQHVQNKLSELVAIMS